MGTTTEQRYYENPAIWESSRYLDSADQMQRFRTCVGMIPDHVRSVLDVGAGNGVFLRMLEQVRPELSLAGLERSQVAVQHRVSVSNILVGSADELPIATRSVDLVAALEVIEHLPFGVYERALEELERVAAAYILVSVPYLENRLRVRCPYCACEFNPFFHMRRFDDATLQRLLRGFRCERLVKVSTIDIIGGSYLRAGYRRLRARAGFYPPFALCPQCGFAATSNRAVSLGETARDHRVKRVLKLGQLARRLLPKRLRPHVAVCLFRRR